MRMARHFATQELYDEALDFAGRAMAELKVEEAAGLGSAGVEEADIREFQAAMTSYRSAQDGDRADPDQ